MRDGERGFTMRSVRMAVVAALTLVVSLSPASAWTRPTPTHAITWDQYSLMIDGTRTFVWSGEFHPFRLPSPSLWTDVLQKMKADGYNTVSMYFDWDYHS